MTDSYSRPNAQRVDGKIHVRASSLGHCDVALAWDLQHQMGMLGNVKPLPPPPPMQQAMDDSSSLEEQAIDILRDAYPDTALISNEEVFSKEVGDVVVTGTPDVLTTHQVFEVKCMGKATYQKFKEDTIWETYLTQGGAYNLLTGLPVTMAIFEKHEGALTGEYFEQPLAAEWSYVAEQAAKHLADMDLEQAIKCPGESDWCPWSELHSRPECEEWVKTALDTIKTMTEGRTVLDDEIREEKERIAAHIRELGGTAQLTTKDGVHKFKWVETHVIEKKPREYDKKYLHHSKPKPKKDPNQ